MEKLPILLNNLKSTVQCLSMSDRTNSWEICGGLDRLHSNIMSIFMHGCSLTDSDDSIWDFIQEINWPHPPINTFLNNSCSNKHSNKSSLWIYKSLENHTLSEKLTRLLSDEDHLHKYYIPEAFLCQKAYSDATILCLQVIEFNQPLLLLKIDSKLYFNYASKSEDCKALSKLSCKQTVDAEYSNFGQSLSFDTLKLTDDSDLKTTKLLDVNYEQLLNDNINANSCQLSDENKSHGSVSKQKRRRTKSTLPLKTVEEPDDETRSLISEKTLIPYDELSSSKYLNNPALVYEYFPGQDLFKYLSSGQFVQANDELERENAHFKISEVIIGFIEQIKCNQKLNSTNEVLEKSDEEIIRLKQRIRFRQKQKLQTERHMQTPGTSSSDYLTESTSTDLTDHTSSLTSSYCSSHADDVDEFDLDDESINSRGSPLPSKFTVHSPSSCSSSHLTVDRTRSPSVSSVVTADSVALSLIREISSENNWPLDVNVQWLISEHDAPQKILPLPSSCPVNPHEPEDQKCFSRLRGTIDWAPPRPQIIFTSHPPPIRKKLMEHQNYRCSGCSMLVAVKYASKFRYCFYLGRYFCTACHVNNTNVIPGRIISKWDFSKYPVSCFSSALLERMLLDPLFNIADLNSTLYKRVCGLEKVRSYRLQLYYIKDFIFSCRFANRLKQSLDELEAHIILKPDLYSIQNMIDVKSGELGRTLHGVIVSCNKHTANCQLCLARGFVCEMCEKHDVLFPWHFGLVTRCADCGSCYHKKCFDKLTACPRCPRIVVAFERTGDGPHGKGGGRRT